MNDPMLLDDGMIEWLKRQFVQPTHTPTKDAQ